MARIGMSVFVWAIILVTIVIVTNVVFHVIGGLLGLGMHLLPIIALCVFFYWLGRAHRRRKI